MSCWEWAAAGSWLARSAGGGALVLLLAWVFTCTLRAPAPRQRIAEWGVITALCLAGLSLMPAWITLPLAWLGPGSEATVNPGVNAALPRPEQSESGAVGGARAEGLYAEVPIGDVREPLWWPEAQPQADVRATEETVAVSRHPSPAALHPAVERPSPTAYTLRRLVGWLLVSYAAASVVLLGRWLCGYGLLVRCVRRTQPPPPWAAQLFQLMIRGDRRKPRLRAAAHLRVPLSCGVLYPTVIVPAALCAPAQAQALR
jgi:hypothetical protein